MWTILIGTDGKYKEMNVHDHIERMVKKYNYAKIPTHVAERMHELYLETLPPQLSLTGDKEFIIRSIENTPIAIGYERIVIGDYGAFIEINKEDCFKVNICCKLGQEFRYRDQKYKNKVKYYWYTTKDTSDVKIYFQQRTVTYADYKPDMIYISPFEILLGGS